MASLSSPGWPRTLGDSPASALQVLGVQSCTSVLGCPWEAERGSGPPSASWAFRSLPSPPGLLTGLASQLSPPPHRLMTSHLCPWLQPPTPMSSSCWSPRGLLLAEAMFLGIPANPCCPGHICPHGALSSEQEQGGLPFLILVDCVPLSLWPQTLPPTLPTSLQSCNLGARMVPTFPNAPASEAGPLGSLLLLLGAGHSLSPADARWGAEDKFRFLGAAGVSPSPSQEPTQWPGTPGLAHPCPQASSTGQEYSLFPWSAGRGVQRGYLPTLRLGCPRHSRADASVPCDTRMSPEKKQQRLDTGPSC